MLKALRLLDVGEGVGEPRGAVMALWLRTRVVVEANDVVMAPEGCTCGIEGRGDTALIRLKQLFWSVC